MDKIQKLREALLKLANESAAKKSFEEVAKSLLKFILEIEKRLIGKIDTLISSAVSELKQAEKDCKEAASGTIKDLITKVDQKLGMVKNGYTPIKGKDYFDGDKGDKGEKGDNGSPDTPNQILDKISGLLEIRDIKELKDKLEELEKKMGRRPLFGGGGFSAIAMNYHIIDDETLAGTPNEVLTDFTITHIPSPATSLKVFINGQRMKLTTDYTLSGQTITFLMAPPTGSILTADYRI